MSRKSTNNILKRISAATKAAVCALCCLAFWILGISGGTINILQSARADELIENYPSVRALGMGNAYTPIVSDKDSLFYNPAGLAKVQGITWTIFDLYVGANGRDVYEAYQDYQAASSGSSETSLAERLRPMFGKKLWIGGGGKSALVVPYFGVAVFDSLGVSAYLSNPAYPDMNLNFYNDYGYTAGLAFNLIPEVLSLGIVGRRVTRIGAAFPIGVSTLANLSQDDLANSINNRGNGYGVDYGMNIVIPTPVKPTFSFVWKNIGYTSFTKDAGARAPPMIRDEMIAGFGLNIDLPGLDIKPAVDFKYMNREDQQLGKKIHLGVEFDFPILDLRAGLNQGYYTLGVGIDLGIIKIDAATYGVELGEYPGQHEDRRYIVQLGMELGFDPASMFGGKGKSGGGGRLKQRR